ncbi:MAG: hypothetical protein KC550_01250 [Nanoarchaeota archaeon]|nr:hypothetical protein [Nanoarchaeota archaeon]
METINIKQLDPLASIQLPMIFRELKGTLISDNQEFKSKVLMEINKLGLQENELAQNTLHNEICNFESYYDFQRNFSWEAGKNLYIQTRYGFDLCFTSDFVIQHWNIKDVMSRIYEIFNVIIGCVESKI